MSNPTDAELIEAYWATLSVWKAGKMLGIPGQSAHRRLKKLRVLMQGNGRRFTRADASQLERDYVRYRDAGNLATLAEEMGRTKHFIARHARRLGLTDKNRKKPYACVWKGIGKEAAREHFERFRSSPLNLNDYCLENKIDDLGFSRTMQEHFPDEYDAIIESKTVPGSEYQVGRHVEYAVMDDLRRRGYHVMRSPRSRSPIDLVAVKIGAILLIQCRLTLVLDVAGWNDVFDLAASIGAVPVVAGRPSAKVDYRRMTGRKDGSKRPQPMKAFVP